MRGDEDNSVDLMLNHRPIYTVMMAADDNYAQHLGVCLISLFENNADLKFVVYVLSDNISISNTKRIESIFEKYGNCLIWINPDKKEFEAFQVSSYYTTATFFRLKLADYLGDEVKRVLYLDPDMIVSANIRDLLDADLAGAPLAAVNDTPWQIQFASEHIGIDNSRGRGKYFNAGMMLIDVDAFKSYQVFRKAKQIITDEQYQCHFLDQDILNIIFRNTWKELPCKWNLLNGFLKREYMTDVRWPDIYSGIKDRAIIHFSAKEKPWSWFCMNPLKEEYFKYLRVSPWAEFRIKRTFRQKLALVKNQLLLSLGLRKTVFINI